MRRSVRRISALASVAAVVSILIVVVNILDIGRFIRSSLVVLEHRPVSHILTDDERARYILQISDLQHSAIENEKLRSLLDFHSTVSYRYAIANVISRDPLNPSLITLDRGVESGVVIGQPVVDAGALVGTVIRVTATASTVELLTSDTSRIAVKTQDASQTEGIAEGYLEKSLRMEYVLDKVDIAVNDIVVTSGLVATMPPNIVVGTVNQVITSNDALFKTAIVQPLADTDRLSVVSIVVSPQ